MEPESMNRSRQPETEVNRQMSCVTNCLAAEAVAVQDMIQTARLCQACEAEAADGDRIAERARAPGLSAEGSKISVHWIPVRRPLDWPFPTP